MAASNSGDPRKRAAAKKSTKTTQAPPVAATSADQWVSNVGGDAEVVSLPSGNAARVRRVGPEAFLTAGLMPDTVTPIVEKAIHSKKGLKPVEQAALLKDPKQLGALMELLDRTLCYATVEPRVVMPPNCSECGQPNSTSVPEHTDSDAKGYHIFEPIARIPGVLYADTVALDDKMFVMNFAVGGTRDLERFRSEFGAGLASLSAL